MRFIPPFIYGPSPLSSVLLFSAPKWFVLKRSPAEEKEENTWQGEKKRKCFRRAWRIYPSSPLGYWFLFFLTFAGQSKRLDWKHGQEITCKYIFCTMTIK